MESNEATTSAHTRDPADVWSVLGAVALASVAVALPLALRPRGYTPQGEQELMDASVRGCLTEPFDW